MKIDQLLSPLIKPAFLIAADNRHIFFFDVASASGIFLGFNLRQAAFLARRGRHGAPRSDVAQTGPPAVGKQSRIALNGLKRQTVLKIKLTFLNRRCQTVLLP